MKEYQLGDLEVEQTLELEELIFVDDIPETFVDGQSQIDNINFEIIDNIEVLRGVNSSLYGSSSGGVISIRTIEDFNDKLVEANLSLGSFNTSNFILRMV